MLVAKLKLVAWKQRYEFLEMRQSGLFRRLRGRVAPRGLTNFMEIPPFKYYNISNFGANPRHVPTKIVEKQ